MKSARAVEGNLLVGVVPGVEPVNDAEHRGSLRHRLQAPSRFQTRPRRKSTYFVSSGGCYDLMSARGGHTIDATHLLP